MVAPVLGHFLRLNVVADNDIEATSSTWDYLSNGHAVGRAMSSTWDYFSNGHTFGRFYRYFVSSTYGGNG